MLTISQVEKDRVNSALKNFKEKPQHRGMVLCEVVVEIEEKTASGILLSNSAMKMATNTEGAHGKPQLERMYDLKTGVVIAKSDKCECESAIGDVIRFVPLSAHKLEFGQYDLVLIQELDYKTNMGNIFSSESNPVAKKVAKKK